MGNVKSENVIEKIIESYIFDHSFNMSILIEKNKQGNFDVLYANSLAMHYFSAEVQQSAASFFGDLWTPIKRRIRKSQRILVYTTEIQWIRDGASALFELDFQRYTEGEERKLLSLSCVNGLI